MVWLRGGDVPFDDISLLDYIFGVQDGVDECVLDFYIRTNIFVASPNHKTQITKRQHTPARTCPRNLHDRNHLPALISHRLTHEPRAPSHPNPIKRDSDRPLREGLDRRRRSGVAVVEHGFYTEGEEERVVRRGGGRVYF